MSATHPNSRHPQARLLSDQDQCPFRVLAVSKRFAGRVGISGGW